MYKITLLVLIIALISGCNALPDTTDNNNNASTSTPVPTVQVAARPTYVVQRGNVEDIFTFTGRWQPRDQLNLSFTVAGSVRQVNVKRGDAVKAGDLLADYDITNLENQLANAQLQLETAQSNQASGTESSIQSVENAEMSLADARLSLEQTRASSPWTNVASARVSLDDAERALDEANRSYLEALSHPEQGASAVDNAYKALQDAESRVKSAEISYFSASQNYNNYLYQLKQAENKVTQAEINLERAKGNTAISDESVRSAQLNIDQINAEIANSSLYAPIDGVILDVYIKSGDNVQAYSTVIIIGLPQPKEIIATLAIADAQRLTIGGLGVCQVVNQPETAVQCAVRRFPINTRDSDQTTRVAASLENVPDNQLIEVNIPLEIKENVLWLPPSVIRTFQNRTFVVLQTPEGERAVDVVLGLQTDDRVEIVSGVNEGDVVVAP